MIVKGREIDIGETIASGNKIIHSDSIFSIFVKKEFRGKGYAHMMAKGLSSKVNNSLLKNGRAKFSHEFIASDKRGAHYARAHFSSAFLCLGFPPYKAARRLESILAGGVLPKNLEIDAADIDSTEIINSELARQTENFELKKAKKSISCINNTP